MKEVLIGNASLWDFAPTEKCLLHVEVLFIFMFLLFQVQWSAQIINVCVIQKSKSYIFRNDENLLILFVCFCVYLFPSF